MAGSSLSEMLVPSYSGLNLNIKGTVYSLQLAQVISRGMVFLGGVYASVIVQVSSHLPSNDLLQNEERLNTRCRGKEKHYDEQIFVLSVSSAVFSAHLDPHWESSKWSLYA